MASRRSLRGLDWLNFFVANTQTGFGPFIAVYLTTEAWTQVEIGEALSLGTAEPCSARSQAVLSWIGCVTSVWRREPPGSPLR